MIDAKITSEKIALLQDHLKNYLKDGYTIKMWHGNEFLENSSKCSSCEPSVNNTRCYNKCFDYLNKTGNSPIDALVLYNTTSFRATCYCVYS